MNTDHPNQENALTFLLKVFTKTMKDKGATDDEIKSFMNNLVLALVDSIQQYDGYKKRLSGIIHEASQNAPVSEGRQVGMLCEMLDQTEDALGKKINEVLGYNNVINLNEENLRRKHGIEIEDITDQIMEMLRRGDL
jgi:hypothetical protein